MIPIPAEFESRCPACLRMIDVGDHIVKVEDVGWVHPTCRPKDDGSGNPICPECFIQHAGECA